MNGEVVIGVGLDTKSFDKQIEEVEYQLKQIDYELSHAKELKLDSRTIKEYELKAEKLTNQLASLRKKQEDLNATNLSGISTQLSNIGNGVEGVIKKVTRWGLAIFGVRSAYMFIRQAMSTLSGYNEQLGTDVEYIRFALASTLQPVIERIIQLVFTLLQYINYIAKAWFGVNLFAKASTKAFQKNNKEAKKLSKTLASFDEMNILQDNKSKEDSGVGTPSVDLSKMQDVEIPEWIKWIADHKKEVLDFFVQLGLLIAGIKLAKFLMTLGVGASTIGGIVAILGGLIIFIKGIIDYLKNPTWENFAKILAGIAVIAAGVFLIFGGFPALIVAVIGLITALGVAIYKNWNKIQDFVNKGIAKFNEFRDKVVNAFATIRNKAQSIIQNMQNLLTQKFGKIGTAVGNVIASAFKRVVNGVLRTIENILNTPIRTINSLIGVINKVPGINIGKLSTFNLPRLAKGGIVNMPGRGINYGGANIGEKAPEAVIPFTDEQVMDRLGQSIARHMVINATITNSMNGRVISREIQRVQNQSNFAMNR